MVTPAVKQDSNNVGTYIAAETSKPGVLPATPNWIELEPNSFDDFGGENTLLSRKFISNSRQRTKGKITDHDAGGGVNIDLTQKNHQEIVKGLFFAEFRDKGRSGITVIAPNAITVQSAVGFGVGSLVAPQGMTDPANRGPFRVSAIVGNVLTVAGGVAEAVTAQSILSNVGVVGAAGDLEIDASGTYPALTSTVLNFTNLGLNVGEFIYVGGDAGTSRFAETSIDPIFGTEVEVNNGFKRIRAITATRLEFDKSEYAMVDEDGTGLTIALYFGRFIHNEKGTLIKRFPWQIERQLGAPDLEAPEDIQAEYIIGSFFNEATFNVATADKINVDLTILSLKSELRDAAEGPKAGNRIAAPGEDAFNTSTDIVSFHMAVVEPGNEAPTPLFAYLTDVTFNINNNLEVNKAVGVVGGFDVTAGTFEVGLEATAYFGDIAAVQAVKRNADVTLHTAIVANNAGIVIDMPLIALGGGRLDVEVDTAIMLPLTSEAATAKKLNAALDYTLSMGFFDYLPTRANPESF